MIKWITGTSVRRRRLILALAAVLIGAGVVLLRDTPSETLPDFSPPMVQVRTEALGLSAAEVEQLLTVPMEQEFFNGLPWLQSVRSESIPGLSSVDMIFQPGTDPFRARQMVQERLTLAHALPNVSAPPLVLLPLSSTSRTVMVGLSSKSLSLIDMSVLARWRIKPRLQGVPGVANVAIWGQRERQLQVQVDPARLNQQGVTLDQVIHTTGNAMWSSPLSFVEASTPGAGGFIDTSNQRFGIQNITPITSAKDLAQVAVVGTEGNRLRLSDVAEVVEDHQPLIGDAVLSGGPSLLLVVERFPNASVQDVTRGVEQALESLRPGLSGIDIDTTIHRPATYVESSFNNLTLALLLGLLLLIIALFALVFDWRSALISLLAVVLSAVAAAFVLFLFGATINLLILAGLVLALAVMIDDAVVGVDAVRQRLRGRDGDGESRRGVIHEAAHEIRTALLYPTLVIVASAVPLLFVGGVTGTFLRTLGLAYLVAVLVSTLVALTVTVALSAVLLARPSLEHRESRLARWLRGRYDHALSGMLGRARLVVAAGGVLLVVGLALLPLLSASPALPPFQDRDVLVQWRGTPGMSLPEMSRVTEQARRQLSAVPGVRNVGAHVGRAVTSDKVVGVDAGEIWVSIDGKADYTNTVSAIRNVVDGYPGFFHDVLTYPEQRVREVRAGQKEALVVRLFGRDLEVMRAKSAEIRQTLAGVDGVVDPRVDLGQEEPTVEIEVLVDKAQQHGLKPGDIRRASAALLQGIVAGSLFEEQKVFDVVVWSTPATRQNLTSINELLLDKPDGTQVRLGEVADVRLRSNPQAIRHEKAARYVDVYAGVRGRSLNSVVQDVNDRLKRITFPQEHHTEILGQLPQERTSRQLTLLLVASALFLALLLVQAAVGGWRLAVTLVLAIPAAASGAVIAALLTGNLTSLVSLGGILAAAGLAVRQGVVLVRHCQSLEREAGETPGRELVLRGSGDRFAPVVTTALTAALALLPLAVLGSISGLEIVHPLAITVLGGLVTTTLVGLFVTPGLYLGLARRPAPAADDRAPAGADGGTQP
jgi:CzcA family heavy metal efflux pump